MKIATRFRLETFFIFSLVVLGIVIATVSLEYGFGSFGRPGPGLYPVFIGVAISTFAFFLLVADLRSTTSKPVLDKDNAKTLIFMTLTFCFWIIAMPLLGYVIVTLVATYAFCKIMKLEGWWKPMVVSGGTALFVFLLFDYWLYIDLPRGIFD